MQISAVSQLTSVAWRLVAVHLGTVMCVSYVGVHYLSNPSTMVRSWPALCERCCRGAQHG
jgi:hypothetical protein